MTTHTPTTGTGLTGDWHVSSPLTVRADLALSGELGGVEWLDDVPESHWMTLAGLLWMPSGEVLRNCRNCAWDAIEDGKYSVCTSPDYAGDSEQYAAIAEWIDTNATSGIPPLDADGCPGFKPRPEIKSSQRRRPSEQIKGAWTRLGHLLAAPLGLRVVVVQAWVAPVLKRPDGSRRPCAVVSAGDGRQVVVVSDGGEVVAFVPVVRGA